MAQFGTYNNSSAPDMRWYADLSYSRISNSVVRVYVTVTGEITNHQHSSVIGNGEAVTVYATVNGVSQDSDIKAASAWWYGDSNNPRSCYFSFDITSNAAGTIIPVSYHVSGVKWSAPAAVPTQSTSFATPAMLYTASDLYITSRVTESSTIYTDTVYTTITPQYSSFRHTIVYSCNGHTVTHSNLTTSDTLYVPPSWITDSGSAKITAVCTTYNGSTEIGTDSDYTTVVVPETVVPTIDSVTITRIDGDVPSSWGIYVKGKSSVKIAFTASGAQGSTINGYTIRCGSAYQQGQNPATFAVNTAGDIAIIVEISDTRGRMVNATRTITAVDYAAPKITDVSTVRCISSGAESDEGTYAKCTGTYVAASVSGKNVVTRKLYYRQYGTDYWSNAGTWVSGTAAIIGSGLIDADHTYDIKYEVSDSFTTISRVDLLSSAHYLIDVYEDSDGNQYYGIGKAAEYANLVDSAHPIKAPSAAFDTGITIDSLSVPTAESGAWTPYIIDASPSIYTTQAGTYYKVGKMVTVTGNLEFTSLDGVSNVVMIYGLPFMPLSSVKHAGAAVYGLMNSSILSSVFLENGVIRPTIQRVTGDWYTVIKSDWRFPGTIWFTATYETA